MMAIFKKSLLLFAGCLMLSAHTAEAEKIDPENIHITAVTNSKNMQVTGCSVLIHAVNRQNIGINLHINASLQQPPALDIVFFPQGFKTTTRALELNGSGKNLKDYVLRTTETESSVISGSLESANYSTKAGFMAENGKYSGYTLTAPLTGQLFQIEEDIVVNENSLTIGFQVEGNGTVFTFDIDPKNTITPAVKEEFLRCRSALFATMLIK